MAEFSIFEGLTGIVSHTTEGLVHPSHTANKWKQPIGYLFPKGLDDQHLLDPYTNLYNKSKSHPVQPKQTSRTCAVFKKMRDQIPETKDGFIEKLEENLQAMLRKKISPEERHKILSNYNQFSQKPSSDAIFHFSRQVDVYQTFMNQKDELSKVLQHLKLHQHYPVDPIRDPKIKECEKKLKKLTAGMERQGIRMISDLQKNSIIDAKEVKAILEMVQSKHLPENFFDRIAHWIQHFKNTDEFQKIVSEFHAHEHVHRK